MPSEIRRELYNGPLMATDVIIEYVGRTYREPEQGERLPIILIQRKNFPYGLALPGGFAEHMSLEANASKEGTEETCLEIKLLNPEHPLCVHSAIDRDPRAHIASATYDAWGWGIPRGADDAKVARPYAPEAIIALLGKGNFAFPDHERALQDYFKTRGYEL